MKIKHLLFILLFFVTIQIQAQVANKFSYGITAGLQISDPKYYDLFDPYPYNRIKGPGGNIYGFTNQVSNISAGAFVQHAIFTNKLKLTLSLLYNKKGYREENQTLTFAQTYRKNYLDIPLSVRYCFFNKPNNSLFSSVGLYQSFILGDKTVFPNPATPGLNDYDKRLCRANDREVNLTGFSFGTGYRYHFLEAQLEYKNDHHYEYALISLSYYLH